MPSSLLKRLPNPERMQQRLRTFAMLDAVLAPGSRCFEFHPKWSKGEQMGAFKDGSGNFFFAWFTKHGAVLRGFHHERPMLPGVLDGLPTSLAASNEEPAFALDALTFCLWSTGGSWQRSKTVKFPKGVDPDGSDDVLACFQPNFHAWAEGFYGEDLDKKALAKLEREEEPLTADDLEALSPDFEAREVKAEAKELGFALELATKVQKKAKPFVKEGFGKAEFTVRLEPTHTALFVLGREFKRLDEDVYGELFTFVNTRLSKK